MRTLRATLWTCPSCGHLRSDSPWTWTHAQLLTAYGSRPGMAEDVARLPDPVGVCRDCNLNGWEPGEREEFEAALIRHAGMAAETYARRRAIMVRICQTRRKRMEAEYQQYRRGEIVREQRVDAVLKFNEAYNHLCLLDAIWYRLHPEEYHNTWSRVGDVMVQEGDGE